MGKKLLAGVDRDGESMDLEVCVADPERPYTVLRHTLRPGGVAAVVPIHWDDLGLFEGALRRARRDMLEARGYSVHGVNVVTGWTEIPGIGLKKVIGGHEFLIMEVEGKFFLRLPGQTLARRDSLQACQVLAYETAELWDGAPSW